MRGSVNSQLGYIWRQIDGIGESKAVARSSSDLRSVDGARPVSEKVHSYEYKDEIFKTGRQLGTFARERFGIKDFERIDGSVLEAFFEQKIADGVSRSTLENYISHVAKIEVGLRKIAESHGKEYRAFGREDLAGVKELVRSMEKNGHVDRSYRDPGAVVSNLEGAHYVVGRLQLEHGLRVSEATHIKADQLMGNALRFKGKGGYEQIKELSPDLANLIKEHMKDGVFKVDQNAYREALRESSRIEGETYSGSHGLRYNYAQRTYVERLENNLQNGMDHDAAHREALRHTSESMGHHREEITNHYLGR